MTNALHNGRGWGLREEGSGRSLPPHCMTGLTRKMMERYETAMVERPRQVPPSMDTVVSGDDKSGDRGPVKHTLIQEA